MTISQGNMIDKKTFPKIVQLFSDLKVNIASQGHPKWLTINSLKGNIWNYSYFELRINIWEWKCEDHFLFNNKLAVVIFRVLQVLLERRLVLSDSKEVAMGNHNFSLESLPVKPNWTACSSRLWKFGSKKTEYCVARLEQDFYQK